MNAYNERQQFLVAVDPHLSPKGKTSVRAFAASLPVKFKIMAWTVYIDALAVSVVDNEGEKRMYLVEADSFNPTAPLQQEQVEYAARLLDLVSLIVPRRLAQEEIGDALERTHRLASLGRPRWEIWLKVSTTVFWVLVNSLREITSAVRGRASAKP